MIQLLKRLAILKVRLMEAQIENLAEQTKQSKGMTAYYDAKFAEYREKVDKMWERYGGGK